MDAIASLRRYLGVKLAMYRRDQSEALLGACLRVDPGPGLRWPVLVT